MNTGEKGLVRICLFLSGASALVYETAWLKQIVLVVGSTAGAVSTVLGIFMLGLGLGALALGSRADRARSPLRLYACLELGVGLYALLLPRIIVWARPLYVELARSAAGQPGRLLALRIATSFVLLLVPTLAMGATFPVLVRFAEREAAGLSRDIGNLYAINLVGAMAGSLGTGFALIRLVGVQGATISAALVNLGLGLVAFVWSGRDAGPEPVGEREIADPARPPLPAGLHRALWCVVLTSGLLTLAFEVLWTRVLVFSFLSTVYGFTVILATVLLGLALGSLVFPRLESRVSAVALLASVHIGAGISALLLTPVAARTPRVIDAFSDWAGPSGPTWVGSMALCSALVMLLPATLMGAVFPLGMKLLATDLRHAGRRLGTAYLVNTLGCVAGSLATGFLLVPLLGLKGCLMALGLFQALLGTIFIPWLGVSRKSRWALLAGALGAILLAACVPLRLLRGPNPFDPYVAPSRTEAHRDGVTGSVSIVVHPQLGRMLRIDGFEASSDRAESGYMSFMTHIPMLLHPDPRRLLVICFGTGRTAGAGLLYPRASVDVVDINEAVFGFAGFFRSANHGVAQDPRVRLIIDDGRNYLLTTRERYDVITSEPMPPHFSGVVNLYTREYYALAREHLAPGGFVAQWLPFHLVTVPECMAIIKSMQEVFPETTLWIQSRTGILVSRRDAPIVLDVAALGRRLTEPGMAAEMASLQTKDVESFVNLYSLDVATLTRLTSVAPAVTDDHPTLEFHAPRHRWPHMTGSLETELARGLGLMLNLQRSVRVPLAGAPPEALEVLQEHHANATFATLGDLYLDWGVKDAARLEYQAGLAHARQPRDRALFLFALAQLALSSGQPDEARSFLDQGLALWPGNQRALELGRRLEPRS